MISDLISFVGPCEPIAARLLDGCSHGFRQVLPDDLMVAHNIKVSSLEFGSKAQHSTWPCPERLRLCMRDHEKGQPPGIWGHEKGQPRGIWEANAVPSVLFDLQMAGRLALYDNSRLSTQPF